MFHVPRFWFAAALGLGAAVFAEEPRTALKVTVLEADRRPALSPAIEVRTAGKPWQAPRTSTENPAVFDLSPGEYDVAVRAGTGDEIARKRVAVEADKTAEVTIRAGTGTLELTLTAGGKPLPSVPLVRLLSGTETVASLSESPARFQAREGTYTIRLELPGGQTYDLPDVNIPAGETVRRAADVPCGRLKVNVAGGERYPFVEVQQGGKLVAAVSDNPARFVLLSGRYEVSVRRGEGLSEQVSVTIAAGEEKTVDLTTRP